MAHSVDMTHTARSQKLTPEKLIKFLIAAEGGPLAKELHRAGIDATPAAVSQRRRQIPPAVFRKVFLDFTSSCAYGQPNRGYKGCRVLACDGTAINMARDPSAPSFVCNNSAPTGYNQVHLSPLFDIYDRTYFDAVIQPAPRKDEPGALVEMLKRNAFSHKTIIVLDRGYEGYNVIAHLMNTPNVCFVLRVKHNHSAMREIADCLCWNWTAILRLQYLPPRPTRTNAIGIFISPAEEEQSWLHHPARPVGLSQPLHYAASHCSLSTGQRQF